MTFQEDAIREFGKEICAVAKYYRPVRPITKHRCGKYHNTWQEQAACEHKHAQQRLQADGLPEKDSRGTGQ